MNSVNSKMLFLRVGWVFSLLIVSAEILAQPPRPPLPPDVRPMGQQRPRGPMRPNGPLGPQNRVEYWLPPGVSKIQIMLVGGSVQRRPAVLEEFCKQYGVGLASPNQNLATLAKETNHPEIESAWLVHTGTSAGALAATMRALKDPERVLAVIPVHGAMLAKGNDDFNATRGGNIPGEIMTIDVSSLLSIPMLLTYDNGDGFVSPVTQEGFVQYGRAQGAPWAFCTYAMGNHTDIEKALEAVILPWLAAVIKQRLPGPKADQSKLQPLVISTGWLGDVRSKIIAPVAKSKGEKSLANWFPDEATAQAWKAVAVVPNYTIPEQKSKPATGIIQQLKLLDPRNNELESGVNWRVCTNFQEADQICNNIRYYVAGPVPASIAGCDWIRPMQPGKDVQPYSADPIATFQVASAAEVTIAIQERTSAAPAWLAGWTKSQETLQISNGNLQSAMSLTLYQKRFAKNETVTLGAPAKAERGGTLMYLTFVKPTK